ncbi:hypothetical protein OH76DRAFT_1055910 [Lentinus brumalis]|uniref:Uncharacterized protein n=1 Tax=Lentinus brumalis TaxID=2498619 RepID=A0A371DN86_9APHY|nr:hypothetical protein OH76DRAFT_1055910 [Polyporus brumalis]
MFNMEHSACVFPEEIADGPFCKPVCRNKPGFYKPDYSIYFFDAPIYLRQPQHSLDTGQRPGERCDSPPLLLPGSQRAGKRPIIRRTRGQVAGMVNHTHQRHTSTVSYKPRGHPSRGPPSRIAQSCQRLTTSHMWARAGARCSLVATRHFLQFTETLLRCDAVAWFFLVLGRSANCLRDVRDRCETQTTTVRRERFQ